MSRSLTRTQSQRQNLLKKEKATDLFCFSFGGCASEEAGKNLTHRYIIPEHTTNMGGGSVMVANSEIVVPIRSVTHASARGGSNDATRGSSFGRRPCPRATTRLVSVHIKECQNRRFRTRPWTEALDPYTKKKFSGSSSTSG